MFTQSLYQVSDIGEGLRKGVFPQEAQKQADVLSSLRLENGGNSIGFLDRLKDRLKMGDGLKVSDLRLGMS